MSEEFKVTPKDTDRVRKNRRKVRLYFVGHEMQARMKGKPIQIYAKSQVFTLPALGEYMVVDEVLAKDLIAQSRWLGRATLVAEENGGKDMADLLKKALADGQDLDDLNLAAVQAKSGLKELDDDDLLAELARRGLAPSPAEEKAATEPKPARKARARDARKAKADDDEAVAEPSE